MHAVADPIHRWSTRTSTPSSTKPRVVSPGDIRVGAAQGIIPLLREFGADPNNVIQEAGLDPSLFENGDNLIPYAALGRLLSCCVARTHCPHFGLLVGQRGSLSAIGPLGGLMQHSPTVGEALSSLVEHLHLHDRGGAPTLTVGSEIAVLGYAIYQPGVESQEQISDGAIALGTTIMRALCGPDWVPDEVLLPRDPPADPQPYRRSFRAPVRFAQEVAAFAFPVRWLAHRISGADPIFHQVFEAHIKDLEAAVEEDWKEILRRMLRTEILTNRCSAAIVADRFSVHRRTLSRRLRADGARFQSLVDEVRYEIARQLMAQTRTPLSQVADALGYSEASAFTRAFRRWSGQTPTVWRAEHCSIQIGSARWVADRPLARGGENGRGSAAINGTSLSIVRTRPEPS